MKQILLVIINHERIDLLLFILKSKTTHSLFLSFSYHFRIQFLSQFVQNYFDETSENIDGLKQEEKDILVKISNIFKNEICEQPYAPISMIVFLYIHPDSRRFVNSYYNTTDIDIERFIRSNYESA